MKIECILKRTGGTRAELQGIEYHFEPLDDGSHVAEVTNNNHVDSFLAVPEAYRVYHGQLSPKGKPTEVSAAPVFSAGAAKKPSGILNGSSQHQAQYEIGGTTYALGDIVRAAFAKSGLTEDEWNELDEDDVAAKLDIVLDDMAEAAETPKPATEADERAALTKLYQAKFGKAPHHKTSTEAIRAKLAE